MNKFRACRSRLHSTAKCVSGGGVFAASVALALLVVVPVLASEAAVRADKANAITFPAEEARFVRFVVLATNTGAACIDELEVYGPDAKRNLALKKSGGKATASSSLSGHAIHQIAHLNDGQYGNDHSWIAGSGGKEWAQIELAQIAKVSKVVFSRDRTRQYGDRVPTIFEIQLSTDGETWKTVKKVATKAAPVALRRGRHAGPVVPPPPPPPGTEVANAPKYEAAVPREDELGFANLALNPDARPTASSLLGGYTIHKIAQLNDGRYGNKHSWISKADPSWAEIDLGGVYWVYKVAFGSDSSNRYNDRAATTFSILAATDYQENTQAETWKSCYKQAGGPPVHGRREFKFEPTQCRWLRIAVDATNRNEVRIDEIEVFGQADPIPSDKIGPAQALAAAQSKSEKGERLRYAFLGEEHAWLKTYGRADLSPRLVPYNGRVKDYPRHVGDDRLPLPTLSSGPKIDGSFDDPCWQEASRGVVRVASPYRFEPGPLIHYEVSAGRRGDDLFLALRTDRLLSSHVAVISSGDWQGCGVVVCTKKGLVFNTYADGKPARSTPIDGAFDPGRTRFEMRLPLALFDDCKDQGLRVGLGMGGKHTSSLGRPVNFAFSSLSLAEQAPCTGGAFRVRLAAASDAGDLKVRGNAPGLEEGLTLAAGKSKTIAIPAKQGPIGPEYELTIHEGGNEPHTLHLFRYDPLERTLHLMGELVDRLAAKGLDVRAERNELARLRKRHEKLMSDAQPDLTAEREAFFEARVAKRRLFFREPDLEPIAKILFVKRRPFEPSHNYSVNLDARFRPGGGVFVLDIPRREGRFEPGRATITRLFESKGGIARTPMANLDLSKIYFAYRPSKDGHYHIMSVNPDGSGLEQITDGPFHDYWPCPLPDGGLAFITTRCKARYLCWRPQAAILFRMDADGQNERPLSFANLSEWAPSVMRDGRILWTRSEYIDKGADFSHTLWAIRPDGSKPELVFGNTIIQPNGYANGREVPGTNEICCTLISHFGDLNGPIALLDINQGRFNPKAIKSLTPEVPRPGLWPMQECFRDPVPLARDYFLCAHAPRNRFGIYVIDRFGNREVIHADPDISIMCPTILQPRTPPPVLANAEKPDDRPGEIMMMDVYEGIAPAVKRGTVKYIRVVEEVRSNLERLPSGEYRKDHPDFIKWYAAPVDKVSGPSGWPSYVAKAPWGIVPVAEDGSAHFTVPAGKTLYFQALDKDFNELQRMRSVVQLQPGEKRSCIGCHESRRMAPPARRPPLAMAHGPVKPQAASWGAKPFSFEKIVQPVLDANCVRCHDKNDKRKINLTGILDADRIPASYRTLIAQGWVHYLDCGWNSGGCEKREPLTFGSLKSKLWQVIDAGHYDVKLTTDEMRRIKTWIDLNCPLWPDYVFRPKRPASSKQLTRADTP